MACLRPSPVSTRCPTSPRLPVLPGFPGRGALSLRRAFRRWGRRQRVEMAERFGVAPRHAAGLTWPTLTPDNSNLRGRASAGRRRRSARAGNRLVHRLRGQVQCWFPRPRAARAASTGSWGRESSPSGPFERRYDGRASLTLTQQKKAPAGLPPRGLRSEPKGAGGTGDVAPHRLYGWRGFTTSRGFGPSCRLPTSGRGVPLGGQGEARQQVVDPRAAEAPPTRGCSW